MIDKDAGIIYVSTSDGKLRGLDLKTGQERMQPADFTNPFARDSEPEFDRWRRLYSHGSRLRRVDGTLHSPQSERSSASRGPVFYTSNGRPGGAWGRAGLVAAKKGVYPQTADGPYDPAAGEFGETLIELSFKDLRLVGSYTPSNWEYLNGKDLDLGSTSPVVFPFQKWSLLASTGKKIGDRTSRRK